MLEAIASGLVVEHVFVPAGEDYDEVAEACLASGVRVFILAEDVFASLADAVTPQPAIAVVHAPSLDFDDRFLAPGAAASLLVLVDVSDPGNVGTLIRTAEAAGFTGLVASATADVLGPKVVRASAGSILRLPVADVPPEDLYAVLGKADYRVAATAMHGEPYTELQHHDRLAIVLGSESHGVRPDMLEHADEVISIPMSGPTESLNVSIAGAVLAFDRARRMGHQNS